MDSVFEFLLLCMHVKLLRSCRPWLPGSSLHGILRQKYWSGLPFSSPSCYSAAAAKSLRSCLTVWPHRWQPTRLPRLWDPPGMNTGVGCHFLLQCRKVKIESEVAHLCLTLSDPMDCSLPGSSVRGICQARVLEWGVIAFSDPVTLDPCKYLHVYILSFSHPGRYSVVSIYGFNFILRLMRVSTFPYAYCPCEYPFNYFLFGYLVHFF